MTVDFNDYFWGEKNNGFDVLYHNMKYGLVASKDLSEYLKERVNVEENNSKLMTKLANKATTGCGAHGTFAPVWTMLKTSTERLSGLHADLAKKIGELAKDITKYADDLHKRHKTVKEEETPTLDIVQAMQTSTVAVQKAKDVYTNRVQEVEKLKRDAGSPKDVEKVEAKLKKQADEYKVLVDKHNPIKNEFERKMTVTCKRFQDIEESHLRQMREFLVTYVELIQTNQDMVGQVHQDFKRQFLDMTVDKLLEQFVLNKYTGLEKPELIELDLVGMVAEESSATLNINHTTTTTNNNHNAIPLSTTTTTTTTPPTTTSHHQQQSSSPPHQAYGRVDLSPPSSVEMGSGSGGVVTAPVAAPKRELNIRSWFSSSSMASSSSPPVTGDLLNIDGGIGASGGGGSSTSKEQQQQQQRPISPASSGMTPPTAPSGGGSSSSSSEGVKGRRAGGLQFNRKQRNGDGGGRGGGGDYVTVEAGGKATDVDGIVALATANKVAAARKDKSSRRTTSLLNIFMSNVQGSRSGDRLDAFSAPTSPMGPPPQNSIGATDGGNGVDGQEQPPGSNGDAQQQQQSSILRNPLRGSKFSGFLRSRREKAKSKKETKKKKSNSESNSVKEDVKSDNEDREETSSKIESLVNVSSSITKSPSSGVVVAAGTPEIDEDGYSIQPKGGNSTWDSGGGGSVRTNSEKGFYSSSDSDSEDEQKDKKIHVEIKPLSNGAPISASVDELRATVETLSLSTLGGSISNNNGANSQGLGGLQSPTASNVSTPVTAHPYAPLQSPTFSMSNNSASRYADLGDIFSEVAEINKNGGRQIPTPTSATSSSSIAIPRPPSRRSEAAAVAAAAAGRGRTSPMSSISRADSVGSLEFRTASIVGMGSSRGPSPLTIGMSDTIPIAVAFHEIIHAFFRGADESRCQVKISGDMMLSFPAGIVGVLANNPQPPKLGFRIKADQNLEAVLPNRQLVQIDKGTTTPAETVLEVSMPQLTALLRRQSEQNPGASYFNVDILKYQVRVKPGAASCPFQLVSYWKCEPRHTDLKIDYKYNAHAMSGQSPLLNVSITVPVDGGVKNVQSKPHSAWLGESNRLVWNFTDISQYSENNGVGTLRARLEVASGPSTPAILSTQFNCEGKTLSGVDFTLTGSGYRVSLVKRRFVSGKYICEADGMSSVTPTPMVAAAGSGGGGATGTMTMTTSTNN